MPYYLIHAGASLQQVTTGGILTALTLPTGVTVVESVPCRFATLAGSIVVVNGVSVNIAINPSTLATRVLTITAPTGAPTVAASSGTGNLNGSYRFAYTYAIITSGVLLTESPMSPITGPLNFVNKQASWSAVTTSGTAGVTHRILYQTVNGGTTFFETDRIADNTTTTATTNDSDYDLALLEAAEPTGLPPGNDTSDKFRLIVAWKDRLFAAADDAKDDVYISGNRQIYSWSASRRFTVKPAGEDEHGVTAFMARRDELVMGKRRKLWKLVGTSPSDFEQVLIADGIGTMSQDASIVIHDVCYFLGEDGFYEYGPNGVTSLSRDSVHPWFTTDDYFNRRLFPKAFAKFNALYGKIELHLAAAGSERIDRWVDYDLKQRQWYGPHKTDDFTPTCGGAMDNLAGNSTPIIGGSDGFLYRENQSTFTDNGTAIAMDIQAKFHAANNPDIMHYWGEPSVLTKIEGAGTLTMTPYVGDLAAVASTAISIDLTKGRQRLRRLGTGRLCRLQFTNSENNQGCTIYGYEVPTHELGRR